MKFLKLIFAIFLVTSGIGFSQEVDYSEEVAVYLDRNNSLDQYGYAYDQLLDMLENQFPKTDENSEAWKYMESNKENTLSAMKDLLIPIYVRHFSQKEIQGMTLFYNSETGRQLVADRSKMSDSQKVMLNRFYNSVLGKKIIEKQPVLTKEIGEASEGWSRDLYETAISLLKN